jgi:Mg-chelatase subunit ChlD
VNLRTRYAAHGLTTYPPGQFFDQLSELYVGKLFMVIDVSGSMEGARLKAAVAGARDLLSKAVSESYEVGVITFDDRAKLELGLTMDLRAVDRALARLGVRGGTDMSRGIELAHRILRERRGERVMAIFSDGETDRRSALAAAEAARRDDIRIIATLGGTAQSEFMRQVAPDSEDLEVVPDSEVQERIAGMAALLPPTGKR